MAFTCREIARLQTDLQLDGNLQQLRFAIRVIPGRADAWPGLLSAD